MKNRKIIFRCRPLRRWSALGFCQERKRSDRLRRIGGVTTAEGYGALLSLSTGVARNSGFGWEALLTEGMAALTLA